MTRTRPLDITIIIYLYATNAGVLALRHFEAKILSTLNDHGWQLEVAFRPSPGLGTLSPPPDEIHILKFLNQDAFHCFRNDPRHQALKSERAQVIAKTEIIEFSEIQVYG